MTEGARPPRVDSIGRLSFVLESASAVVGCALQFNPFEPPQLRPSKDKAAGALEQSAIAVGDAGKRGSALIEGLEPPAYLVIMGYRRYSDAVQLNKGGPATGGFLQFGQERGRDLEVPAEATCSDA